MNYICELLIRRDSVHPAWIRRAFSLYQSFKKATCMCQCNFRPLIDVKLSRFVCRTLYLHLCLCLWSDGLAVPAGCCHSRLMSDSRQMRNPHNPTNTGSATGASGCIDSTGKEWRSQKFHKINVAESHTELVGRCARHDAFQKRLSSSGWMWLTMSWRSEGILFEGLKLMSDSEACQAGKKVP